MSFAMAPTADFAAMIAVLKAHYGILCQNNKPLWSCETTEKQYMKLPKMTFELITNDKLESKTFTMPRHAYMKLDPRKENTGWLLFTPWDFQGLGGQPGEQYWVLGA